MKRPPGSLPPALLVGLALAGCGGGAADPCPVETDERIALDARPLAEVASREAWLECTGESGGAAVSCAGAPTLELHACADGFGFVLARSTRLLLRLRAGGGTWQAGARLDGGESLRGSVTFAGLPNPAAPVPAAGALQAATGALQGNGAVFDVELRARW